MSSFKEIPTDVMSVICQSLGTSNVANLSLSCSSANAYIKSMDRRMMYILMKTYLHTFLENRTNEDSALFKVSYKACKRNTHMRVLKQQEFNFTFNSNDKFLNTYSLCNLCKILGIKPPPASVKTMLSSPEYQQLKVSIKIKYKVYPRKNKNDEYLAKISSFNMVLSKEAPNVQTRIPGPLEIVVITVDSNNEIGTIMIGDGQNVEAESWIAQLTRKLCSLFLYALCSIQNQTDGVRKLIIANNSNKVKLQMTSIDTILTDIFFSVNRYVMDDTDSDNDEEDGVPLNNDARLENNDMVSFFTENYQSSEGILGHNEIAELIKKRQYALAFFLQSVRDSDHNIQKRLVKFTLHDGSNITVQYDTDNHETPITMYSYLNNDGVVEVNMEGESHFFAFWSRNECSRIKTTLALFIVGLSYFKNACGSLKNENRKKLVDNVQKIPKIGYFEKTIKDHLDRVFNQFNTFINDQIKSKQKEFENGGGAKKMIKKSSLSKK